MISRHVSIAGLLLALLMPALVPALLPATALAQLLPPATQPANDLAGRWSGTLKLPNGQELGFSVNLLRGAPATPAGQPAWHGVLDIPLQGILNKPLTAVTVEGQRIRFNVADFPGNPSWDGTLEGELVKGTFSQGGGTLPFDMKRGELERPRRPQEPKPPFPYEARDVTFPSLAEGVMLAGTLTLPQGEGPFPAVALVSGSGPQNRDEEILGHKPFLVLADRLTRAGVAVLRYDDRGIAKSTGNFIGATSRDFADDAEGAVRFLRQHPKIAAGRVGIAGHSEGGIIAPIVAARSEEVAFIVLLAGPGVSGDQVLIRQVREGALAEGAPAESAQAVSDAIAAMVEAIKAGADEPALRAAVEAVLRAQMNLPAGAPVPEQAIKAMLAQFGGEWFRFFFAHDPAESLAKVSVPVLVLQGELDRQVNAEVNVAAIKAALAHNPNVRIEVLPGLNHLFQPAKTGGGSEYAAIEITMDEQVPALMAEWIKALPE